ncbi:MAG TPA: HI0074 family nucleotidyltransferase substrate-binding subunit, partial [Bdellovibrionota bacterium]|nr:HI0074 family nucleotidyltransferase substrate-binding subunit [Bdellovibrionota bacterium]
MDIEDLKIILRQFDEALSRFEEGLKEDPNENPIFIDGTIQRFEFCFEMSWKVIKRFLQYYGIKASSPREAFKEAFKRGWLTEGDELWSAMIDDRNDTVHTYNKEIALKIYSHLNRYFKALNGLRGKLQ